jgi:hypothetical protein
MDYLLKRWPAFTRFLKDGRWINYYGRYYTRPYDTLTVFWLDGRIGNSSPSDVIGGKQRTGSLALRFDNHRCLLTGRFCRDAAEHNGSRMRRESRVRFCEVSRFLTNS